MSSSSDRCEVLGQAPSGSNEPKTHMRFLDFPAEIRIQIYKYLLLTRYVTTRKENEGFIVRIRDGRLEDEYDRPFEIRVVPGSVRCQNVWIEKSFYSVNILRVNRQLYLESSKIFSENSWIFVCVNRSLFAQDVKDRGFNAIPVNSSQGMKIATLTLCIKFEDNYWDSDDSDGNFVMNIGDTGKLVRALSTSVGLESAKLTFIAGRNFPKESNPITEAFSRLWSVGKAYVCGPGDGHSLGTMTRQISTKLLTSQDRVELVIGFMLYRLRYSLAWAQAQQARKNWHVLAIQCEAYILYVIDCHAIYHSLPLHYFPWEAGYSLQTAVKYKEILEIYDKLLRILTEAQFSTGDYIAVMLFWLRASGSWMSDIPCIPNPFVPRACAEWNRLHAIEDSSSEECSEWSSDSAGDWLAEMEQQQYDFKTYEPMFRQE